MKRKITVKLRLSAPIKCMQRLMVSKSPCSDPFSKQRRFTPQADDLFLDDITQLFVDIDDALTKIIKKLYNQKSFL